jgi:hypothetical protein
VLLLVGVSVLRNTFEAESLPKLDSFLALFNNHCLGICFLVLSQKFSMVTGLFHVRFLVGLTHFFSNPDESLALCLNDSRSTGVKPEESVASLVHVLRE